MCASTWRADGYSQYFLENRWRLRCQYLPAMFLAQTHENLEIDYQNSYDCNLYDPLNCTKDIFNELPSLCEDLWMLSHQKYLNLVHLTAFCRSFPRALRCSLFLNLTNNFKGSSCFWILITEWIFNNLRFCVVFSSFVLNCLVSLEAGKVKTAICDTGCT